MTIADALREVERLDRDGVRSLGEAARSEGERLARGDPSRLSALYDLLEDAASRHPPLRPWAMWARGTGELLQGRPAGCVPLLVGAARLFRLRDDEHDAARVELALSDALASLGLHRRAARRARRALVTFVARGDRQRQASALINLGGLAEARDQVRRALVLWRRAGQLLDGDDGWRRACLEANMAAAMQALGRFTAASTLYERSARRFEAAGSVVSALQPRLGLAEVRAMLGHPAAALEMALKVETRAAEVDDDNLLFESRLLVAQIELALGHPERAATLAAAEMPRCGSAGRRDTAARFAALRAVAVFAGADGDPKGAVAEAEHALAAAGLEVAGCALRGELAQRGWPLAGERLRKDASRLERAGLKVQADMALLATARGLHHEGASAAALELCQQVLTRHQASVWPLLEALQVAAEISAGSDPRAAVRHLRRAVRVAESVRGRLACEADRSAFNARVVDAYSLLIQLLLARGDSRSRRQAFDLVARVKSRSLLEAIDRRSDPGWRSSPQILRRWNDLRGELAAALAALEGRRGESSRYAGAALGGRIRQVARRIQELELELARSDPRLAAVLTAAVPRLRPRLRPGEAFLELFLVGDDLVLFFLDSMGLRVTVGRGLRQEVERRVDSVRFQLSKAAYGRRHVEAPGGFLVEQARGHLAALGELILAPLDGRPRPEVLWVAPHGALHNIPVAALELGGKPILEACPVAAVPGSGVLALILDQPHAAPRSLAIAGAAPAGLPEIAREIEEIACRFPGCGVVRRASMAEVRAALVECDAVHIASHGAFHPHCPAGSGLRLADGWLTVVDLLRQPVRARLVTLGACASGEMAVVPGEELMGLVRQLLAAGVHTVAAAPGALDDALARRASGLFYEALASEGPGHALRRALLELRADHPHPALWAAMQLYGNPRTWENGS